MRVGLVPFLNVAPFAHIPFEIIYEVPSKLNLMMRQGELDAAFCSSIEVLQGDYERLPHLGLAARGSIMSVNLYLKGPLESASIRLDPKSSTANCLLQILCDGQATFSDQGESFLLIGDDALRQRHIEGFRTIDLAAWWFEKTGLPFVFALFLKQKGVDSRELEQALVESIKGFGDEIDALATQQNFPKKVLVDYFNLCHYQLDDQDERGLQHFFECKRDLLHNSL
ncbi:MAG: Chorismate dehydratase [Chlamydiales bacterium]|nr:Chorismate dehydratase [Chlamydiales bacterium]MCH9635834.1 Chorismate dehydratase [Chlamydiales bacterium]MCH9704144.1 menaquinone biosynthesis protein [Chlamydiota bacterium]